MAVTWCPICGSGVVYDATVNGQYLAFGVSGKLADDDLVLYDHETESEWNSRPVSVSQASSPVSNPGSAPNR
ncbi:DUF3179 domain-containing (seleno)protein [Halorubrum persicum]|uniref:DUF3179 domain-containing (seleno)protein n=1 Tax=Halorubrum persicum TaxID=1383844 RepID=UPI003742D344